MSEMYEIVKSSGIDKCYWVKITDYLNNTIVYDKSDLSNKKILLNLRVLSKVDLSKVMFIYDKSNLKNLSLKCTINKDSIIETSLFGIDIESEILSSISTEILYCVEKEIKENNGIIIYNLVEDIVKYSVYDGSMNIEIKSIVGGFNVDRVKKLKKIRYNLWKKDMFSHLT